MDYNIRKVLVNSKSVLKQNLANGGGVAISLKKTAKAEMKKLKKSNDLNIRGSIEKVKVWRLVSRTGGQRPKGN